MEELRGEEAGMKAEPAKQRRGGGEREGGEGRGAAEQSSRDPDRNKKEKENRFSFYWQQGKKLLCFYITNRTLTQKEGARKNWDSVSDNGGRINAGLENGMCISWTTEGDRERTRGRQRGLRQ